MRGDGALLSKCMCCVVGGERGETVAGRSARKEKGEGRRNGEGAEEQARKKDGEAGKRNNGNGLGLAWTTTKRHEWRDRSFSRKNIRKRGKG